MIDDEVLPFDLATDLLTEDEQQTAGRLLARMNTDLPFLRIRELYYDGEQRMNHLGIAVPRELEKLRTAAGWPGVVVDTIDERLEVAGFRVGSAASTDDDLWDIWTANRMDFESGLAHLDALMFGRAFIMVGTRDADTDDGSGTPLITVESPQNMAATYDAASRQVTAALQRYRFYGAESAALYLPEVTIQLIRPEGEDWQIRDRDEHGLGRCPVVMLANRSRSSDRYGKSEITPELMSWTDAACRTLLRMEIGAEFFSSPQRYIIGASEEAFQDPDGDPVDAWQTYIGRVLALERDGEGNVPAVGTFAASDPTPHTNQLLALTRLVSSRTGIPQNALGFSADNPASAEGILAADATLNRRARRRQRAFGPEHREVMQLALMIENNGKVPADLNKIEVLWTPPETPTPTETSTAIASQISTGSIPATSSVTLAALGWSPLQIEQLAADRTKADNAAALQAISATLQQQAAAQQQAAQPPDDDDDSDPSDPDSI
ncbi:MAG TPA: phage portal protein [Frankiaceae bacterium]|nr:phage portal protein [Frankiaceae bacterium]